MVFQERQAIGVFVGTLLIPECWGFFNFFFFFWKLKSDSEAERDAATGLQSPVLLTPFAWSRAVPRLAGSLAWCRLEALFARRVPKRCVRASV